MLVIHYITYYLPYERPLEPETDAGVDERDDGGS